MGGVPVIKGTRIPIERIMFLLKDGYNMDAIHQEYSWVGINTLEGLMDEISQVLLVPIMAHRFHKHKLLLDENFAPRLNGLFDVKHLRDDLHKSDISDVQIYDLTVKLKRLIVTTMQKISKHSRYATRIPVSLGSILVPGNWTGG